MTPARRLTDVPGIGVGHATDLRHLTGCTVVVCERGAVGVMQHLMEDDGVKAIARAAVCEGKPINITAAHLAVCDSGICQPVTGDGEHFRAAVDADTAPDMGREQFQDSRRAGTGIEYGIAASAILLGAGDLAFDSVRIVWPNGTAQRDGGDDDRFVRAVDRDRGLLHPRHG